MNNILLQNLFTILTILGLIENMGVRDKMTHSTRILLEMLEMEQEAKFWYVSSLT